MIELNKDNFEEIIVKNENVVVDFWAEWCIPCKMVAPIFQNLAKKYEGKIIFAKVNIDQNLEIAEKFGILSIPTFLIFKNGEKVGEIVGALTEKKLEEKILEFLGLTV